MDNDEAIARMLQEIEDSQSSNQAGSFSQNASNSDEFLTDIATHLYFRTLETHNVKKCYLCSELNFYTSGYARGWGCGYRNLQMMLSCLMNAPNFSENIKNFCPDKRVPTIRELQEAIETAWTSGFDVQGSTELGGHLVNTVKWIGATEIVALLSYLRFKCELVDFHEPSGPNGLHIAMQDRIVQHFKEGEGKPFSSCLYLQYRGHSLTIAGVEELSNGSFLLLILDPSVECWKMSDLMLAGTAGQPAMGLVRKSIRKFKASQYQIVYVTRLVASDQEYEAGKVIKSVRVP